MQDRLRAWRGRSAFKLPEAALLMTESYPEEYSDEQELLQKPPKDFIAVYGQLLIDAVTVENEGVQSDEVEGEYYTEYVLNTDKPQNVRKLSDSEGLNVWVDKCELIRYITAKNIRARFFTDDSLTEFKPDASEKPLSLKERDNLLRIIAALHQTLLENKNTCSDSPSFASQKKLIEHLDTYTEYQGLSKSNLEKVFPEARRVMGLHPLIEKS